MSFAFETPQQIGIEISLENQVEAWRQSQSFSTPGSRRNAYLNHLCLGAVLPLLQSEYASNSSVWPQVDALPSIWELVNGVAINLNGVRLALIPSQDIDTSELRAPQEWVDIPGWAADYYLAVQVNPDDRWVQIWGYTTHHHLKTHGSYDANDHTYCLDAYDLVQDMNGFWVVRQLCPNEVTRTAIAPLPEVPDAQAETLLQRLKNPSVILPRLAIPFELWGALLERDDWRQRLSQQRQASQREEAQPEPQSASAPVNLSQWFQDIFDAGWQSLESLFEPQAHVAFSLRQSSTSTPADVKRARQINLETPTLRQTLALVIGLNTEPDGRIGIRIQLHPVGDETYLPANLTLTLRSTSGETLQSIQTREKDNYIRLKRFKCLPGKRFSVQLSLDEVSLTEEFVS
ncbi:MAG: DUF1822 family protein [Leptolyngbyaceae cyanobacterium MO_188.B28]|nr:DUF1822 family protein [Leptolyngbyaceae cyanobacterium MO_188.B28]